MTETPRYDVLLADPPWQFKCWDKPRLGRRTATEHYSTMSLKDLCALPVRNLVGPNAALFLWAVWPSLFEYTPSVLSAWGFEYKTCAFLWAKARRSGFGFFMGLGHYTRANTECCLLAVRGRMPVVDKGVTQMIFSPVREHSRKPDEQYGKIERLYPNMRYLELFARRKREGWDVWGNEVEGAIHLEDYGD